MKRDKIVRCLPAAMRRIIILAVVMSVLIAACQNPETEDDLAPTSTPSTAEVSPVPDGAGLWWTFRAGDGLPYPSVTDVAIAPDGVVWVSTGRGAASYDGQTWTIYRAGEAPLSDLVLAVAVTSTGAVWFGTDKGVTLYDRGAWVHYTEEDGLPSGYVQTVAGDHDDRIWLGFTGAGSDWAFGNGAAHLDAGGSLSKADDLLINYPPARDRMAGGLITTIADLADLGVWFGVSPEGTVRRNDDRPELWRLKRALPGENGADHWDRISPQTNGTVTGIIRAPDGQLWIGTTAGIAIGRVESSNVFVLEQHVGVNDGLPSEHVLTLAAGPDGRIWIGTDSGLAVYSQGTITTYTTEDGLADDYVRAIALAANGDVWTATPRGLSVCCLFRE